jgi:hypothetical protein
MFPKRVGGFHLSPVTYYWIPDYWIGEEPAVGGWLARCNAASLTRAKSAVVDSFHTKPAGGVPGDA